MKKLHQLLFAIIVTLSSAPSVAVSPQHDEFYSSDMYQAIKEAKQRTHHYDYSRARRYHRTTSQSVDLPRLLNSEMAGTTVKAPLEVDLQPEEERLDKNAAKLANKAYRFKVNQVQIDTSQEIEPPAQVTISQRYDN